MLHRLRRAMVSDARSRRLEGDVEADETIVGGPVKGKRGRGVTAVATKTLVFGVVEVISYIDKRGKAAERAGRIRLAIARKAEEESIGQFLMQNVAEGSTNSGRWLERVLQNRACELSPQAISRSEGDAHSPGFRQSQDMAQWYASWS